MYKELIEIGLEKFAGDQELATAFAEGFLKEAAFPSVSLMGHVSKGLGEGVGRALGAGVVGAGVALGIHGMSSALSGMAKNTQRAKFEEALAKAVSSNSILKNANKTKLRSYAETVFKFAPHVAGDANLLAHVLSNTIDGESMDTTIIRTLTDLESRYSEIQSKSMFTPKTYV